MDRKYNDHLKDGAPKQVVGMSIPEMANYLTEAARNIKSNEDWLKFRATAEGLLNSCMVYIKSHDKEALVKLGMEHAAKFADYRVENRPEGPCENKLPSGNCITQANKGICKCKVEEDICRRLAYQIRVNAKYVKAGNGLPNDI